MGPPSAEDSLRKALTFGADRAVLLTDRFFAGADTLATSYALAAAIRKIGETYGAPDIIFTGKQTIDGDTAQVGPGIAKRLDLLQLTYVAKIGALDLDGAHHRGRAPVGGRRTDAAHHAALPDHHAGGDQRDPARRHGGGDAAPRAPPSSNGARRTRASKTSPNAGCGARRPS